MRTSDLEKRLNEYDPDINLQSIDDDVYKIKTIHEMVRLLESRKDVDIEANVIAQHASAGDLMKSQIIRLNKAQFLEAIKSGPPKGFRFREFDSFGVGADFGGVGGDLVGHDFIPLLGGPFYKQQYIYDYLKAHMTAFYSFHHDPIARGMVTIMRDFTLGRGFKVVAKGKDKDAAQVVWDAIYKVNNFQTMADQMAIELSLYGEVMTWELPGNQSRIVFNPRPGDEIPQGVLPRFRLVDPSCIWDIITHPEDMTRVLAYQWSSPTQYQIYTRDTATGESVASSKFIYNQIPGDQIDHWKINCVSNEKRGRSDLYPILGYLKRLRDSVNFEIIKQQKNAAWGLDTTIDGTQEDVDAYVSDQQALGTIAPAGSEYVHNKNITRQYLGNASSSGGRGGSSGFDWCLSMACAGFGIPVGYMGTHLSGGGTRASAMVATEPVAKRFEMRRYVYEQIFTKIFNRSMDRIGLTAYCEITFPDLVTQDRSAKLADLALAQQEEWIAKKTAADMAASEFGITEFNYGLEAEMIAKQGVINPEMQAPLSTPGKVDPETQGLPDESQRPASSLTSEDKRSVRLGRGL